MSKQSLDDFLKEMAAEPKTLRWDVIAAFDRDKTNYLLLQEYISRFNTASIIPPYDSFVGTGGTVHYLRDVQFDSPRLRFEGATLTDGRARCMMRAVGGIVYETSNTQGIQRAQIKRLGFVDGLVGPIMTMTIFLVNAPGHVTNEGSVELDLAGNGATEFLFTGVDTRFEEGKLGAHLLEWFKTLEDSQKKFTLGELRPNPEDALQPGDFRVLTRPARGAAVRGADNFGDGEVLLLIGLDDRSGDIPSGEGSLPYFLPEGFSSNLVISFEQVVSRMLLKTIKGLKMFETLEYQSVVAGKFMRYEATKGGVDSESKLPIVIPGTGPVAGVEGVEIPFDSRDPWSFSLVNGAMEIRWAGRVETRGLAAETVFSAGGWIEYEYEATVLIDWNLKCRFTPVLDKDQAGRSVIRIQTDVEKQFATETQGGTGHDDLKSELDAFLATYELPVMRLEQLAEELEDVSLSIDAFRLNGLLFADDSVVEPRVIYQPGDLTALGDLAPKLTTNRLSNNEPVVVANGTFTFEVIPPLEGVQWSVAALEGDPTGEEYVGAIENGIYRAPTAASFNFAYRRVIVTASKGDWSAKAMVHVVASSVSVFPMVNTVNLTLPGDPDAGYVVWAGSANKQALDWTLSGNAGGRLELDENADVQDARVYYAPIEFPDDSNEELDQAIRIDRIEVKQGDGPPVVCEMFLPKLATPNCFFRYTEEEDGIQFSFWGTKNDGSEMELSPANWYKLSGKGDLSQSGKYTPPAAGGEHYIAVAAFYDTGFIPFWNFVIIPLPLATLLNLQERDL
ncbi:hypothetical protein [Pseudomonas alloputida]|uniref:hypothetical protein n=1 Tax=Pseudomonas alloputida TaxID=1940621 RepID=UPI001E571993|nr:hypothetical protein [Pseudomonas alloputida]MCE1055711.1 hypothetical protein [Pseudomonas alloputida]